MKKLILTLALLAITLPCFGATIFWDYTGEADGFIIYYWRTSDPPADKFNWADPKLGYLVLRNGTVRSFPFADANMMSGVEYTFEATVYLLIGGESVRSNQATYNGGTFVNPVFTAPGADKLLPVQIILPNMTMTLE